MAITGKLVANTALQTLLSQTPPGYSMSQGPAAQLVMLFFDERFTFVPEASQTLTIAQTGAGAPPLALLNIKAPRSGYCFVYVANKDANPVYFDDFQVRHDRGRILEESHYYAYGLKIAALSSKAFAAPQNNYQYQGDYSEFDEDLGWNDFMLRSYDPQIGRFLQHDPYDPRLIGRAGVCKRVRGDGE